MTDKPGMDLQDWEVRRNLGGAERVKTTILIYCVRKESIFSEGKSNGNICISNSRIFKTPHLQQEGRRQ